ncbi:hypothetical protein SAMN04488505_105179 [Chitinophaga rupis]|uniref:Uncharacterized protein n=1 Tax=Chitinophaga rupis TaxID=573321 RepID=A0A1H7ZRM0_9BACT|nr:hypothetical protein SAMN04488505_105179 [Chitinophaga rupis]
MNIQPVEIYLTYCNLHIFIAFVNFLNLKGKHQILIFNGGSYRLNFKRLLGGCIA